MAGSYVLSRRAEEDIGQLLAASLAGFGERQTDIYAAGMEQTFDLLASHPEIGSTFVNERSGRAYRRHRYASHMIYYRIRQADIFIVRLLHVRMLPERYLEP
ncbi:type II toxin-antitoxin system RelE/ParE family toxin [Rhizobium sp. RU36D]|uniref:type II toxin-antitoxin system RelE/ParE family toxin n=1 Tax=Rhizobium sp. RU36D TaxID=1907415 RepID=UPI0009D8D074|nr:type II toxin-antitoxin system RelE/ParE family toxin [Rhizobium sp. RU36D]SMC91190.1 toxin ParE1/3/4 [Rhizobium sp. RU36D]